VLVATPALVDSIAHRSLDETWELGTWIDLVSDHVGPAFVALR
jgi:hypothetical protein